MERFIDKSTGDVDRCVNGNRLLCIVRSSGDVGVRVGDAETDGWSHLHSALASKQSWCSDTDIYEKKNHAYQYIPLLYPYLQIVLRSFFV